jgi:hypothetical protein
MTANCTPESVLFSIEEYKQLREEIRQRDSSMTKIFLTGLIANISLISAISAFYFKMFSDSSSSLSAQLSYFFLAPLLLIIALLSMINAHRQDIRKIASYLQAFYEDTKCGPSWETAHNEMAKYNPEEAHDFVPSSLWCLFSTCIALFFYSLHLVGINIISVHSLSALPFIMIMTATHLRYLDSKKGMYEKYLNVWRAIFRNMNIEK